MVHECVGWRGAMVLSALAATGVTLRVCVGLDSRRSSAEVVSATPQTDTDSTYASSSACAACHPREYQTWHDSHHRAMTQRASTASVRGTFDGRSLTSAAGRHLVERRGDEYWVTVVDPTDPQARLVARRVVMVTGSHHMQVYWVRHGVDRKLTSFPFAYLIDDERWVPNEATLVRPPGSDVSYSWNRVCVDCHAVAGRPRIGETVETETAELGIACEACHGPGRAHVEHYRNPIERYRLGQRGNRPGHQDAGSVAEAIVHPNKLAPGLSSQVCGQCHAIRLPRDASQWRQTGSNYRPGGRFDQDARLVRHPAEHDRAWIAAALRTRPDLLDGSFWSDGMVRVSGREYNGLVASPCAVDGKFTCGSCHSIHSSDPDDQLAAGMRGDAACVGCHADKADAPTHSHHAPGTPGSQCYNCHMPYTTYGLLKAIRSHTIDSPSVDASVRTGRPNACNACHLDETLRWTADWLERWYSIATESPLGGETPAMAQWGLAGDAGQRALVAWHLGWPNAIDASKAPWRASVLARLLDDPYPAVRYIAARSLRKSGHDLGAYDHVAEPSVRSPIAREHVKQIDASWIANEGFGSGVLSPSALDRLWATRDDRAVELRE